MKKLLFAALCLFLSIGHVSGQQFTPDLNGPIHEAFVDRLTEVIALQAIQNSPPAPLSEKAPLQPDPTMIWLGGYWSWSPESNDFIWVSGIWRRPPPDHIWIPGFWSPSEEGWSWVRGFWSDVAPDKITYIDNIPPDQLDENVGEVPGNNYFWFPGYWDYVPEDRDFQWLSGRWVELNPDWILIPAHYILRPEGVAFVAPYWDWPLELRGRAFAAINVPPGPRSGLAITPTVVIDMPIIINRLFIYYPDFAYVLYHHYNYHPEFWSDFPYTPPWWAWRSWWTLSWHRNWGLWWWYGHPEYPAPGWITADIADRIPPPQAGFLDKFKRVQSPVIVTPRGVVSPTQFRQGLREALGKGKNMPVIPANVKLKNKIDTTIDNQIKIVPHFTPSGKKSEISPKVQIVRPPIPQPAIQQKVPAGKVNVLPLPSRRIAPAKPIETKVNVPRSNEVRIQESGHPVNVQPKIQQKPLPPVTVPKAQPLQRPVNVPGQPVRPQQKKPDDNKKND